MTIDEYADVAELGRVLGALKVAGIHAEWVEGEMLHKTSPAEGVEQLAAERGDLREALKLAAADNAKVVAERDEARAEVQRLLAREDKVVADFLAREQCESDDCIAPLGRTDAEGVGLPVTWFCLKCWNKLAAEVQRQRTVIAGLVEKIQQAYDEMGVHRRDLRSRVRGILAVALAIARDTPAPKTGAQCDAKRMADGERCVKPAGHPGDCRTAKTEAQIRAAALEEAAKHLDETVQDRDFEYVEDVERPTQVCHDDCAGTLMRVAAELRRLAASPAPKPCAACGGKKTVEVDCDEIGARDTVTVPCPVCAPRPEKAGATK